MGDISKYAKITPEIKRALTDARALAMSNVFAARIPECGDFGEIAQNLDFAINEMGICESEKDN